MLKGNGLSNILSLRVKEVLEELFDKVSNFWHFFNTKNLIQKEENKLWVIIILLIGILVYIPFLRKILTFIC